MLTPPREAKGGGRIKKTQYNLHATSSERKQLQPEWNTSPKLVR